MAVTQTLTGKIRDVKNKGYLNQLKREGWVPAVIYGRGQENLHIVLTQNELNRVFTHIGTRGIFSLEIEGESQAIMAQVRDIQKKPMGGEILHVDFSSVKMNEKIQSMIRIQLLGEEAIIDKGGVLQVNVRELPVACLPQDLLEVVSIDVAGLEIGARITVSDLSLPANVEVLLDADTVIANIHASSREATEAELKEPTEKAEKEA